MKPRYRGGGGRSGVTINATLVFLKYIGKPNDPDRDARFARAQVWIKNEPKPNRAYLEKFQLWAWSPEGTNEADLSWGDVLADVEHFGYKVVGSVSWDGSHLYWKKAAVEALAEMAVKEEDRKPRYGK